MHREIRSWVCDLLEHRPSLVALAIRQRAKFEGWLKFELAERAQMEGATDVEIEASLPSGAQRADIAFTLRQERHFVELKTPNTNWRLPGVLTLHRPITKNIGQVIEDGLKLGRFAVNGMIVFVLFPVRPADNQWTSYYHRILGDLQIAESQDDHISRLTFDLTAPHKADIIVGSIPVRGRWRAA